MERADGPGDGRRVPGIEATPEFASVDQIHELIGRREISVVDVVRASLERLDRVNPSLGAVVAVRAEAALTEAKAADRIPVENRGALFGVPYTVKDVTETLDLPTTYGSVAFEGHRTGFEADVVTLLRAAGAILIGKTNTPELACEPVTRSELFGETLNPFAPERTPGGSSGGAAAGLATGMFTLAQGTDGGGSIRIPASCCGVVGVKPTRGRVSFAPAAYEPWGGLLHSGPMARSVRDAASMLDVMSGGGDCRAACEMPLGRIRAAYASAVPGGHLDPDVAAAFADALGVLTSVGVELCEDAPDLAVVPELFAPIAEVAFAGIGNDLTDEQLARIGPKCLQLMTRGWRITAAEYYATLQAAHRETARIQRFWETYDVLVTPTVPWVPPRRDAFPSIEAYDAKWAEYGVWETFTSPWNLTGQPAISLPCRKTGDGHVPIGLQLVGRLGGDADLFAIAASFEAAAPWDYRHALAASGGAQRAFLKSDLQ